VSPTVVFLYSFFLFQNQSCASATLLAPFLSLVANGRSQLGLPRIFNTIGDGLRTAKMTLMGKLPRIVSGITSEDELATWKDLTEASLPGMMQ
jgi:hypothetical protein